MVFSSTVFLLLFLPLVLIGYFNPIWKSRKFKNVFLLIASIGFYTWGEPLFVFLLILSIILNWFLVLRIAAGSDKKIRKRFMTAAIVFDIALLFVFKYVSFLSRNIALLLKNDTLTLRIALPIGISFFTFQMMSYVFDVYYGKVAAQKSLINVALYVSLFPQFIAGPIVRYKTVAAEIEGRVETKDDFVEGFSRFVIGLAKKVLLSNYLGFIVDRIFALNGDDGGGLSAASAWLGAIAFNLQLFFDFSGYSDMAIGLGRIFGFHFLENFNYPYISRSITEYWQRWHISLGSWFRDYVFTPLSILHRKKKWGMLFSLFATWFLTGFWHGANWTFMIWGLFYFALIWFEWKTNWTKREFSRYLKWLPHFYMLFFVNIGHVLFRSPGFAFAGKYIGALFGIGSKGLVDEVFFLYFANSKWILLAGIVLSMPVVPLIKKKFGGTAGYRVISATGIIVLFTVSLLVCIKSAYNPFIYFDF
jgi:D-alanyl-lipoteichoic acid acyltransferase DltB (MBOAT superfamily)